MLFSAADLGHICNWPFGFNLTTKKLFVEKSGRYSGPDFDHLPDGPDGVTDLGAWRLDPSLLAIAAGADIAE